MGFYYSDEQNHRSIPHAATVGADYGLEQMNWHILLRGGEAPVGAEQSCLGAQAYRAHRRL